MLTHHSPTARRRRGLLVAAAATALALATAACGSTVQVDPTAATAAGTGSLSQPVNGTVPVTGDTSTTGVTGPNGVTNHQGTTTSPNGTTVPGTTNPGTTNPGTPGDPSSTSSSSSAPTQGTPNSTNAPSESGPLKVGLLYLDGSDATASAIGLSGLSTGDQKAQATAIVKAINAKGGIAGRQVELEYAPLNSNDFASNREQTLETACAQLTSDEHVAFVVSIVQLTPGMLQCLSKGGAALIDDASTLPASTMNEYAGSFAAPGDIAPDRMLKVLVDALWNSGWLTKSSKIGALSYDDSASESLVKGALTQALAAHGLKIDVTQAISQTTSGVAQSSSAVLRYKTAGVDRIIPVNSNPLFVMEAASSQGYHPRYALYSLFGPGALMESLAPANQLAGAAGIGWSPYLDIGRGKKPGPVSSSETTCFSIMQQAGQASSSATTKAFQLQLCDVLFYLTAAGDKVGSAPSNLLSLARSAIGTSFKSADTFTSNTSHSVDGVASYRDLLYTTSCSCFQYGAQHSTS